MTLTYVLLGLTAVLGVAVVLLGSAVHQLAKAELRRFRPPSLRR